MRTNTFLELQCKIECNQLKENRVSRLFRRGGGLALKKSKSTDFGFFLYLLAKTAVYWLFSKIILRNFLLLCCKTQYKCTWVYGEVRKNFRHFGCEMQKTVLGYIEGYEKFFEEILIQTVNFYEKLSLV